MRMARRANVTVHVIYPQFMYMMQMCRLRDLSLMFMDLSRGNVLTVPVGVINGSKPSSALVSIRFRCDVFSQNNTDLLFLVLTGKTTGLE